MTTKIALDHVGLTVPNLDDAIEFFVEYFDCVHVFSGGPYSDTGWT